MTSENEWLTVESLDLDGQGVAHNSEGKVVFIDGALPGEKVRVSVSRRKKSWEQASIVALGRESALRVTPRCPHFGTCGGCKLQHFDASAQVATKQRALEDALAHLGKVKAENMLRPIQGASWGYRYRARLSVRYVHKKTTVLVGFHERKSSYVADMTRCEVLPVHVSNLLLPLRDLVAAMDQRDRLPQIEVAVGDAVTALVLRHLEPLTHQDANRLREFGSQHAVQWWLQPSGPDSVHLLDDASPQAALAYSLAEFGVEMPFRPTDFTQVNHGINQVLVGQAVQRLQVLPNERVIDWFCGLGNFTLPLATRARSVLGVEGSSTLVERAQANAKRNALSHKANFDTRNLFDIQPADLAALGFADKWLIDPPREGAFALVKALADAAKEDSGVRPTRIVYVSCNPATLARDAGLLVHQAGYRCTHAGVVNMFPHTAHVESLAVFERDAMPKQAAAPDPK